MKFGERLLGSQHPPWSADYVDYLRLKQLLGGLFETSTSSVEDVNGGDGSSLLLLRGADDDDVKKGTDDSSPTTTIQYDSLNTSTIISTTTTTHPTTNITRVSSSHSFEKELKHEIQKALLFLLKSMGELASDLSTLSEQRRYMSVNVHSLLLEKEHNHDLVIQQHQNQHQAIQQTLHDIENLRMEYLVQIGSKLLLLLEFVELNIEAIVKIVKKHDKLLSKWEESTNNHKDKKTSRCLYTRLRRQYLPRFAVYSSDPNVRCLFLAAADAGSDCSRDNKGGGGGGGGSSLQLSASTQNKSGNFGGWDVIQWNLEVALRELFQWEGELQGLMNDGRADKREEQTKLHSSFTPLSSKSFSEKHSKSSGSISLMHRNTSSRSPIKKFLRSSSNLLGLTATTSQRTKVANVVNGRTFFEPVIYQIQSSRRRLGQMHHRYIRMVYAHEMFHLIDDKNLQQEDEKYMQQRRREDFYSVENLEKIRKQSIGGEDEGKMWMMESQQHPTVSKLSKVLNLASAGLYMCNYNIVAPTSGLYAQLLGFDPANAGIIIGMTPMAVILSSVLYSWWSSYSYKRAILFASFCCSVGNIVYALALPCNSLKMVFLGRLLTGFGSARVINRRYIADYYSLEDRTSGMSDFVSASAAGMALGPAIAASLSIVAPTELSDSNSYWTIETAPGYVMFVLWSIYFVCNMLFFEEPERIGSATTGSVSRSQPTGGGPRDTTTAPSENNPLLNAVDGTEDVKPMNPLLRPCGNIPVVISLVLLVLLKSVLEGISSSAPTVSRYYFGWGVHASGIYLALLASFVLPTNFLLAYISRRYDDRELILVALVVMFVGILGFLVYGEEYSETRFIFFGLVTFVSCNALEGPTMGLLSKTIPKSLARGILNAGLLATEAGTVGRVVGDVWLSGAAFMGLDQMVNTTFEPMCIMVGLSICATVYFYSRLQPRFEDEDDD